MSPMAGGAMPKPSDQAKAAFTKLVPGGPTVTLRPMFGNLAAFVNGNMFAGLFGEDLFVRLPDDQSAKVRKQGGRDFAPMAGRPMKGYVTVPSTWQTKPEPAKEWIATALELTGRMPPRIAATKKGPRNPPRLAR
jgi:TfoX/Sxy family transcriptional regulator of competence genes